MLLQNDKVADRVITHGPTVARYTGASKIAHWKFATLCAHGYFDRNFIGRELHAPLSVIIPCALGNFVVQCDDAYLFPPVRGIEVSAYQLGTTLVLIPRGTEVTAEKFSWWDILRDMRVLPWKTKHAGWNHAGFMKGARGWLDRYASTILRMWPQCTKLVLAGHSLGAATAVQMGLYIQGPYKRFNHLSEHMPIVEIVLCGEPLGLLGSSRRAYIGWGLGSKTSSYQRGDDKVTRIPQWGSRGTDPSEAPPGFMTIGKDELYDHGIIKYMTGLALAC